MDDAERESAAHGLHDVVAAIFKGMSAEDCRECVLDHCSGLNMPIYDWNERDFGILALILFHQKALIVSDAAFHNRVIIVVS